MAYDSTVDANIHRKNIQFVYEEIIRPALDERIENHDLSKLEDPERSCYDKYIPVLKKCKFGSPEYVAAKQAMRKEGLSHHYAVNRHHTEHFQNGVKGMNLIDLVEHIMDCYAASLVSDTPFEEGIQKVIEGYSEDLQSIILNTAREIFKGQRPGNVE